MTLVNDMPSLITRTYAVTDENPRLINLTPLCPFPRGPLLILPHTSSVTHDQRPRIYHLDICVQEGGRNRPTELRTRNNMILVIKFKRGAATHIQSTILFPDRRNANLHRPFCVMSR